MTLNKLTINSAWGSSRQDTGHIWGTQTGRITTRDGDFANDLADILTAERFIERQSVLPSAV